MKDKLTMTCEIRMKLKFSFWDAIKIRIAGLKNIEEIIKKTENVNE